MNAKDIKKLAPLVAQEILKSSCERIIEDIFEKKEKKRVPEDKDIITPCRYCLGKKPESCGCGAEFGSRECGAYLTGTMFEKWK